LQPDTLHVTVFFVPILKFRQKGLERFFIQGTTAGIKATHAERLRLILGRLNVAVEPRDMALPGLELHPLKGDRKGSWAVRVSGNWRVTFNVDYEDYH
jgi:proteic killer suppression protein